MVIIKESACYGNQRFITVIIKACYWFVLSTPSWPRDKNFVSLSRVSDTWYMIHPSQNPYSDEEFFEEATI
jgi:hypothetical protein